MIARLLRNAKIPNGKLDPAIARLIIVVVESLVARGNTSGTSHLLSLTVVAIKDLTCRNVTVISRSWDYSCDTPVYGYLYMNGVDNHNESKTTNLYSSFYIKAKFNCTEFIFSIIYTQLKGFSPLRGHFNQR